MTLMRPHPGLTAALLLLACLLPHSAIATASFGSLLEEADNVRHSDPERFATLLEALDERKQEALPEQRLRLRYLGAFQSLVYKNEPAAGLAEAAALFEEAREPTLRFRAGSLLVNAHGLMREFSEGLRYVNLTLPLRDEVADKDIRHDGLYAAAVLYNELGQYQLGLQYTNEVMADDPSPRAMCVSGIAALDAKFHLSPASVDEEVGRTIDRCNAIGERMAADFIRVRYARNLVERGMRAEAFELIEPRMAQIDRYDYPRIRAEAHSLLAQLVMDTGDLRRAEAHAEQAISNSENYAEASLSLAEAHRVLYEIATRRRDPEAALAAFRRLAEAEKAHITDVNARDLAYEIVRHETLQQDQQIALLDQQNQVLRLRQQVSEQAAQNTRLLIALLLFLLASIAYWAWRVTRRHHSLKLLAEIDSLTGVCNRRHFLLQAEQCLEQSGRNGDPVSLVMFDLDHFKQINDTYGHVTGDWVLERVAAECRSLCRRVDLFGRLGGEEFAILLPGCDVEAAARVAEQCRARIASIDTTPSGHLFPLAASFGVTDTAWSGHVLSRLLSHSDQALYRAKHGGRNLVCVYAGEPVRTRPPVTPPAGFASQPT